MLAILSLALFRASIPHELANPSCHDLQEIQIAIGRVLNSQLFEPHIHHVHSLLEFDVFSGAATVFAHFNFAVESLLYAASVFS